MRFQEYYESPVFKGVPFSIEDFENWYSKENGRFSYAQDWSGFNIPCTILEPFRKGDFDPLTDREKTLLNSLNRANGEFYIIGATPKDEWFADTVRHEFVHGAYFSNKKYRKEVNVLIKEKRLLAVKKELTKMGYCKEVLNDEANAYLLTEPQTLKDISLESGLKMRSILDKIFRKYFGFSVINAPVSFLTRLVEQLSI